LNGPNFTLSIRRITNSRKTQIREGASRCFVSALTKSAIDVRNVNGAWIAIIAADWSVDTRTIVGRASGECTSIRSRTNHCREGTGGVRVRGSAQIGGTQITITANRSRGSQTLSSRGLTLQRSTRSRVGAGEGIKLALCQGSAGIDNAMIRGTLISIVAEDRNQLAFSRGRVTGARIASIFRAAGLWSVDTGCDTIDIAARVGGTEITVATLHWISDACTSRSLATLRVARIRLITFIESKLTDSRGTSAVARILSAEILIVADDLFGDTRAIHARRRKAGIDSIAHLGTEDTDSFARGRVTGIISARIAIVALNRDHNASTIVWLTRGRMTGIH